MLLPASLFAKSLIGGVLMLGAGSAAIAILVTSGPLAGDDDNQPALQAAVTPTPPATATPTLTATPLAEVTPTKQPATPTAPAQVQLDADGWPSPRITERTIGLDTSHHGVVSAVQLPDRRVFQSGRHLANHG